MRQFAETPYRGLYERSGAPKSGRLMVFVLHSTRQVRREVHRRRVRISIALLPGSVRLPKTQEFGRVRLNDRTRVRGAIVQLVTIASAIRKYWKTCSESASKKTPGASQSEEIVTELALLRISTE